MASSAGKAQVVERMLGLGQGRRVEAVMDPSDTYGDALAWQLRQAQIALFCVSPKRVHDAAEVYTAYRHKLRVPNVDSDKTSSTSCISFILAATQ